ncbi:ABC transporter permease subunit [Paenibacillus sp. MWE-103]|uniref:ABC transporter permease subunit n=1 Tax=Paenibacillus artemisiicola TaxID=1172618 RepID=A0ABS3W593_9BACL|nr:ABC transporter permease subunit [Paenibacillus artemisiicola]MBO7743482.1 ABC transporter permease subunit [Paenibacillus artemisiicola]
MNKTLAAGLAITMFFLAACFFGEYAAPYDLSENVPPHYVGEPGHRTLVAPPFPPSASHPFGTDKYGTDMAAKLLDGAKYTIIASLSIAFFRLFAGGALGLLLGYFGAGRVSRTGRTPIWTMLNGIPIFIIVWMIMTGISMDPSATPLEMTLILSAVLALVGIPAVASTVKAKTTVFREELFILSARSIGAGRWRIVRTHLLPHLQESLLILFVQEIVLILGLFGQLAIFNLFVGGTLVYKDLVYPEYASRTNEWSGLIGQSRGNLYIYPWVLFFPLLAYIAYILGLHMIALGIEKRFKRKVAKFSQL